MNFEFSEDEESLRTDLRALLDKALPDDWAGIWQSEASVGVSNEVTRLLADEGYLTYHWPRRYGGREGSVWEQTVIQEELFARHEPRGGQYMGVNWIAPTIMKYGTDEQKARFLPEIAAGAVQWAQLFSEPDAGTDLAALRTVALVDGDTFVINGEKVWTSYANLATRGYLLCRTDPTAERHHGISVLLVDMKDAGIEVREIPSSVGWHRFHSVVFNDVRVPSGALLGPLNGGWQVAMDALPFERVGNARYARSTRILGLLEQASTDGGSRRDAEDDICDALALGRAAELANYRVVAEKEKGEITGWRASAAFACNAVYEREVAELAEEVLGAGCLVSSLDAAAPFHGEVESFAIRQAPTVTIQAGTYQVQLSIIAQGAMDLPRAR